MISMIAAVTMNGVIGIEDKIPFDYPEDMKHFKENTLNSTVVMGRKTHEGIGRALPKRRNLVISSRSLEKPGIEVYSTLTDALATCTNDVWLIGGASIYEEGMLYADQILLTITPEVERRQPAVRFPWINPLKFTIASDIPLGDVLRVLKYVRIS
jgi:dihydrofolate reductase